MDDRQVQVGDLVRLRKRHPCGGDTWQVTRVGSDIRLRCTICGRYILLRRAVLRRRLKEVRSGKAAPPGRSVD